MGHKMDLWWLISEIIFLRFIMQDGGWGGYNMCYVMRSIFFLVWLSIKLYIQAKNRHGVVGGKYIYKIVASYRDAMLHLDFVNQ